MAHERSRALSAGNAPSDRGSELTCLAPRIREESGQVSPVPAKLDTIPKLLLRNAQQHAARPAFREKEFGIWQTWTWKEAHDEIRHFSLGLKSLGLQRGDTI